jgi:alkylated DNA repair protein alkB family protein 6
MLTATNEASSDAISSSSFANRRFASILVMPRSLVVVKHDMYEKFLHGIQETTSDTVDDMFVNLDSCPGVTIGSKLDRIKPRISLTVRVVPKVLRNKILLGKK